MLTSMETLGGAVPMVEIVRSGYVEGRHHASAVITDPEGKITHSWGEVDAPILPRSVNKPLQTLGMLAAGLELEPSQLVVATSSHSAEEIHLRQVRAILADAGLDESALQTPPSWPCDEVEAREWARQGREAAPIGMDCSGKHAAMLWTCVRRGWPTESYLDPQHPLQQTITAQFSRELGRDEPQDPVAVDGCGALILAASLSELAAFYGALAVATEGPRGQLVQALRAHPELLSGTRRDDAELMRAIPGTVAKSGAEAVYAVGLPDGRGLALKIADGGERARPVLMAALLEAAGVAELPGVDLEAVRRTGAGVLLGGGVPVGALRVRL